MKTARVTPDRVGDTYVAALLQEALIEVAVAFARANKTAALFTLASIERDLIARAEAFPAAMTSPPMPSALTRRIVARIAAALGEVQRAAEEASVQ